MTTEEIYRFSPSTRGFYHSDQVAPSDSISLSAAQYKALLNEQGQGGYVAVDSHGAVVTTAQPTPVVDLAVLKTQLIAEVNAQAQQVREQYVVSGGAQAITYEYKRMQAVALLAAQQAENGKSAAALAASYPYLANEIGLTIDPSTQLPAVDTFGVARAVMQVSTAWEKVNLSIERTRLTVNKSIATAVDAVAAQAAARGVQWPQANS